MPFYPVPEYGYNSGGMIPRMPVQPSNPYTPPPNEVSDPYAPPPPQVSDTYRPPIAVPPQPPIQPPPFQGGTWMPGKSNITLPGFPSGGVTHPMGGITGGGSYTGGGISGSTGGYGGSRGGISGGHSGGGMVPPGGAAQPIASPPGRDLYRPRLGNSKVSGGKKRFF